jgi:streptogramin lyase
MSVPRVLGFALLALSLPSLAGATSSVTRWGAPGSRDGELHSPFAVAVHHDRVYVSDFDNDRVQAFTRDGAFLFAWGSPGSEAGQLHGPTGLAVDADGSVLVADHYNRRIQRFSADGRTLGAWSAGSPVGLAVDAEGRVYATDLDAGRVLVWSAKGEPVAEWGGLAEPWGIAVDPRGNVWVAEHGKDRVARFSRAGEPLGVAGAAGVGAAATEERLPGPTGVTARADGSILVSGLGGLIARFGPDGKPLGLVGWAAAEAPGDPSDAGADRARSPIGGLAAEASGLVWVADAARHQIARFALESTSPAPGRAAAPSLKLALVTPSRGSVAMRIAVPAHGTVSAQVFSPSGRLVWSAPRTEFAPGEHVMTWNGRTSAGGPASAGVYFVRVQLDDGARSVVRRGRVVLFR